MFRISGHGPVSGLTRSVEKTAIVCSQSKEQQMIDDLIAEEQDLLVTSKRQAISDEQQSQRQRQKQRDNLIDDLVSVYFVAFVFILMHPLATGKSGLQICGSMDNTMG